MSADFLDAPTGPVLVAGSGVYTAPSGYRIRAIWNRGVSSSYSARRYGNSGGATEDVSTDAVYGASNDKCVTSLATYTEGAWDTIYMHSTDGDPIEIDVVAVR